jgi:hypothetical protein
MVAVLTAGTIAVTIVQERLAGERLDGELARLMLTLNGVMRTEFGEGLDSSPPDQAAAGFAVVLPGAASRPVINRSSGPCDHPPA